MSFLRKLKLAANGFGHSMLIYPATVSLLLFLMGAEGRSDEIFLTQMSIFGVAVINASSSGFVLSVYMTRMYFLKTLPLTAAERSDTAMLNILLFHLVMTAAQCAAAAFTMPVMLPYFICADCVHLMIVMIFLVPVYFSDKNMYTPAAALEENVQKSVVKKAVLTAIGFMVLTAADYEIILNAGARLQGQGNIAVLLIISAAALIISAVSARVCRNPKGME